MKRLIVIFLLLVILIGISWGGYQYISPRATGSEPPSYETITVTRGDLIATISATGVLEPENTLNLSFETAGVVAQINVQEGTYMKPGHILAQLDNSDVQLQLRQAEANLKAAQAQLAQLQEPPHIADVEAAKAALAAAQAAYRDLIKGPDPDQIAAAEAAVKRAKVQLDQAQTAYDRIKWRADAARMPQAIQLQLATIEYEQAQAQLRLAKKGPEASQIAQALANIAQAQANLDRLTQGPSSAQIEAQEAAVERARIAVQQARRALEKTILKTPIAGTVTAVHVDIGQWVNIAQPAFTVTQLRPLHTTVNVDELDVAQVKVGQPAMIAVDAIPDRTFAGVITYLADTPTTQGGVVTYEARVELQEDDPALRPGMSVSVDIITAKAENVLIIPNRVMRVDRETGAFYVEKLVNNTPVRTRVEVGLRNDQFSEIISGLEEGDTIVIRKTSGQERLRKGLFGR